MNRRFFKNLDQILFLAEQKYEKTKQFRKAMLNSMLPNAIGYYLNFALVILQMIGKKQR